MLMNVLMGAALLVQDASPAVALEPAQIESAIALGQSKDDIGFQLKAKAQPLGVLLTPHARVALAARTAKKSYKPFTAANVTPEMAAAEVMVIAEPAKVHQAKGAASIGNVEAVVVIPKGSKDVAKAIQPIRTSEVTTEYGNLYGATFEGKGLIAFFPLDVLRPGHEVRIIYDRKIGGLMVGCQECSVEIKVDKIK